MPARRIKSHRSELVFSNDAEELPPLERKKPLSKYIGIYALLLILFLTMTPGGAGGAIFTLLSVTKYIACFIGVFVMVYIGVKLVQQQLTYQRMKQGRVVVLKKTSLMRQPLMAREPTDPICREKELEKPVIQRLVPNSEVHSVAEVNDVHSDSVVNLVINSNVNSNINSNIQLDLIEGVNSSETAHDSLSGSSGSESSQSSESSELPAAAVF